MANATETSPMIRGERVEKMVNLNKFEIDELLLSYDNGCLTQLL